MQLGAARVPQVADTIVICQRRLALRRVDEREWDSALFAVDREIRIECQHGMPLADFGHPHDAPIATSACPRCTPLIGLAPSETGKKKYTVMLTSTFLWSGLYA